MSVLFDWTNSPQSTFRLTKTTIAAVAKSIRTMSSTDPLFVREYDVNPMLDSHHQTGLEQARASHKPGIHKAREGSFRSLPSFRYNQKIKPQQKRSVNCAFTGL